MEAGNIYIVLSLVTLALIAASFVFLQKKAKGRLITPLAGLAFAFVIAGIVFGEDRIIGYGFFGIGIILSIVDMIRKMNQHKA